MFHLKITLHVCSPGEPNEFITGPLESEEKLRECMSTFIAQYGADYMPQYAKRMQGVADAFRNPEMPLPPSFSVSTPDEPPPSTKKTTWFTLDILVEPKKDPPPGDPHAEMRDVMVTPAEEVRIR